MAEAFFESMVRDLPVEVSSAGILELGSGRAVPEAIDACKPLGHNLKKHRSTPLSETDLSSADLVIGFERQHIDAAIARAGADRSRAFLITEAVQLLGRLPTPAEHGDDPIGQARSRVVEIAVLRGSHEESSSLEIQDPKRQPAPDYDELAVYLRRLCHLLAARLFGHQVIVLDPPEASKKGRKKGALLRKLRDG